MVGGGVVDLRRKYAAAVRPLPVGQSVVGSARGPLQLGGPHFFRRFVRARWGSGQEQRAAQLTAQMPQPGTATFDRIPTKL